MCWACHWLLDYHFTHLFSNYFNYWSIDPLVKWLPCSGADFYVVKPGNTVPLFSYTPGATNLKFSTIASAFTREAWDIQQESENNNWNEKINQVDGHGVKIKYTDLQVDKLSHGVQVLDASATLSRHWRMSFSKADKDPLPNNLFLIPLLILNGNLNLHQPCQ